jgi:hypothetical protein
MTDTLSETVDWFDIARQQPTIQQTTTQLGVHFEEVREMLLELEGNNPHAAQLLEDAQVSLALLGDYCKAHSGSVSVPKENRVAFLDALCDQQVTIVGVAQSQGMQIIPALQEVNRSNFSKFVDGKPLINESGKIIKGPNYFKPKLEAYV